MESILAAIIVILILAVCLGICLAIPIIAGVGVFRLQQYWEERRNAKNNN